MNELVEQRAATAGLHEALIKKIVTKKKAVAKKAVNRSTVAIILGSLRNEGAAGKVQAQIDKTPRRKAAAEAPNGGGGLDGLMDGSLMALGGKLIGLGLSAGEIQGVARELFKFDRDRVGADRVGEIFAGTPRLR